MYVCVCWYPFFINFKVDKSKSMQAKVMLSAGLFSEYRYCHSSLKDAEQASSCLSSFERPANQCTRVRARINSSVCKDQRRKKTWMSTAFHTTHTLLLFFSSLLSFSCPYWSLRTGLMQTRCKDLTSTLAICWWVNVDKSWCKASADLYR